MGTARVKGIVNVTEEPSRPVVIHGVQHIFHPPLKLDSWPSEDHRTRIVFITRGIDKEVIENTLRVFERRVEKRGMHCGLAQEASGAPADWREGKVPHPNHPARAPMASG